MDWMYNKSTVDPEEFLLGKPIDKSHFKEPSPTNFMRSIKDEPKSALSEIELSRREKEDPLTSINEKQYEMKKLMYQKTLLKKVDDKLISVCTDNVCDPSDSKSIHQLMIECLRQLPFNIDLEKLHERLKEKKKQKMKRKRDCSNSDETTSKQVGSSRQLKSSYQNLTERRYSTKVESCRRNLSPRHVNYSWKETRENSKYDKTSKNRISESIERCDRRKKSRSTDRIHDRSKSRSVDRSSDNHDRVREQRLVSMTVDKKRRRSTSRSVDRSSDNHDRVREQRPVSMTVDKKRRRSTSKDVTRQYSSRSAMKQVRTKKMSPSRKGDGCNFKSVRKENRSSKSAKSRRELRSVSRENRR